MLWRVRISDTSLSHIVGMYDGILKGFFADRGYYF
jgi:hypothetical protein